MVVTVRVRGRDGRGGSRRQHCPLVLVLADLSSQPLVLVLQVGERDSAVLLRRFAARVGVGVTVSVRVSVGVSVGQWG